ncbi:MAG: hypothetical protein IPL39_15050 [Opitutaceae bacterium]|nr:hypothetical protein [Opitutaceae bacterium]
MAPAEDDLNSMHEDVQAEPTLPLSVAEHLEAARLAREKRERDLARMLGELEGRDE